MLPRRLGARFALEALFLVLLAVAAGLADLRPLYIVLVMVGAWILVALAELTSERIDRWPFSYLVPARPQEDEPEEVFGPRPEERTVVAPLESFVAAKPEPQREPKPEVEAAAQEPEPEPEAELPPPPATVGGEPSLEPSVDDPARGGRLRSFLRRREPERESTSEVPPRHVKLLPRRAAPEPSRASQDVAELFGGDEPERPKETGT